MVPEPCRKPGDWRSRFARRRPSWNCRRMSRKCRRPGGGLQDRGQRGDDPVPRRKRLRQGSSGRGDPCPKHPRRPSPGCRFNVRGFPQKSWRENSSATAEGFNGGMRRRSERWPLPKAAPYSSTKSATCRFPCNQSSCVCSRSGATSGGGVENASQQYSHPCGHQPQPGSRTCRRPLPGRLLLPVECHRNDPSAAAQPARRHPAIGGVPAAVLCSTGRQACCGFAEPVRDALLRYAWPGNIRELRNVIERGVILAAGPVVDMADLPSQITHPNHASPAVFQYHGRRAIRRHSRAWRPSTSVISWPRQLRIGEAATKLGINPSTLYRKRKKYGI